MIRCPYCYSVIGKPNPNNFIWSYDPLILSNINEHYQCFAVVISELQQNRKYLESLYLPTEQQTIFTPISNKTLFQITKNHIIELRTSTEKLLKILGIDKSIYFNYDNEGTEYNPKKYDWTDKYLDSGFFQLKGIHVEDLRHFIKSIWIERFFVTSVGDILNLTGTYTGQTDEILGADLIDFTGDMGTWESNLSIVLGTFQLLFSPNPPLIDGYSSANLHVYISPNNESSHFLNIDFTGTAFCSSSHTDGSITVKDKRTIAISNCKISILNAINIPLKNTSVVSASSSANISSLSSEGFSIEITFSSGRSLLYYYGKHDLGETLNRHVLSLSNFTNISMNIGTDYISKWSSIVISETIQSVNMWVSVGMSATNGSTVTESMATKITNIKII